jgi:catechol 2,3-dioxygenase-like lactoylglutathione lyase family enzyme
MWWGAAIESPDPEALASFYSELLGWPVVHTEPGTAVVKPQDSVFLVFQLTEDYKPPAWPPEPGTHTTPHFDFQVGDLDAAVDDAVALGARLASSQPQDHVRVLLDPAGRPFCLCRDEEG